MFKIVLASENYFYVFTQFYYQKDLISHASKIVSFFTIISNLVDSISTVHKCIKLLINMYLMFESVIEWYELRNIVLIRGRLKVDDINYIE